MKLEPNTENKFSIFERHTDAESIYIFPPTEAKGANMVIVYKDGSKASMAMEEAMQIIADSIAAFAVTPGKNITISGDGNLNYNRRIKFDV